MTTQTSSPDRTVTFTWNPPEDLIALAHSGDIKPPMVPAGMKPLKGSSLEDYIVVLARGRDEQGNEGFVVEIEAPLNDGSKEWEVFLAVIIPGRGTIVTHEMKKGDGHTTHPALLAAHQEAQEKGEWTGAVDAMATAGPLPGEYGEVIAGTGEFKGVTGKQQQHNVWQRITSEAFEVESTEVFTLQSGK